MSEGPKLLLIDGNNMAHRVFWAHKSLAHAGRHTGLLFGFLKQLITLHKEFPEYFRIVAWDKGYDARLAMTRKAIEEGILPPNEGDKSYEYKGNRDHEMTPERESLLEQMDEMKICLDLCRCLQVGVQGEEADDILYTYAVENRANGGESIIVSSDNDLYTVLGDGVTIYDAMKHETWTKERFAIEFGFGPDRWLDVAGLMGEKGDNIFGCPSWGPVNALEYVREHGTVDDVIAAIQAKDKLSAREKKLLNHIPRVRLAKELKRLHVVPGVPKPRVLRRPDKEELEKYCISFGFASLLKELWRLV